MAIPSIAGYINLKDLYMYKPYDKKKVTNITKKTAKQTVKPNIDISRIVQLGGVFEKIGGDDEAVGGGNQKVGSSN